ncbi:GNAT family N-acetyltransferase [Novosphingobium colocasiae]|uniref:GNAT family N-acetyltransferase n=1 Tax=Novosphingobium colocasiae TaxID=1256513 RepID=UPI0035AE1A95
MFIRSERLFLRPAWPEDAEDLHAALQDRQVVRNLARVPWPFEMEHARACAGRPAERGLPQFLITLPGAGGARLIGGAGFTHEGAGVEVGLWIARGHAGQGFGTEAGRAILRIAAAIGHRDLRAVPFIDSPASGRVLEKLGFRRTGRIFERYSQSRKMAFPAREYAIELAGAAQGPGGLGAALTADRDGGLCAA